MGHVGVFKIIEYFKISYYWRGITSHTKQHIEICDLCQRVKSLNRSMVGQYEHVESSKLSEVSNS